MELIAFFLLLAFLGALAIVSGDDSRPSEHDRVRNW
jgi:hypothetical protein